MEEEDCKTEITPHPKKRLRHTATEETDEEDDECSQVTDLVEMLSTVKVDAATRLQHNDQKLSSVNRNTPPPISREPTAKSRQAEEKKTSR